MMPNMEVLGPMVRNIHQILSSLFYVALPIAMTLSVCISILKGESPNYVDILRRALVASVLLVSFPEVSNWILDVCDGIASKIDSMSGLNMIMKLAEEKFHGYAGSSSALLLKFDDLFIAVLSFLSAVILYIARYLTIAMYYFFWVMLSILSPILILCYMFPSAAGITKGLYRGLIEVASWKIIWSVQSAMLTALSLGNIYKTEGSYLTLTILNFVIAIGLICTPILVKSLIGEGLQSSATAIGSAAVASMITLPIRAVRTQALTKEVLTNTYKFTTKPFRQKSTDPLFKEVK